MILCFEKLECRYLMAADWQNPFNPLDTDLSGYVAPLDALVVINDINANGMRALPARAVDATGPMNDVSGDGMLTSLDALLVINSLNSLPELGTVAPTVKLLNQHNEDVDVSSFIGVQPVVLYFYPKDKTPGCTVEAIDFRDRADEIAVLGAKVFGVSVDSVASHAEFASDLGLNFDILSDADWQVATAFGVLTQVGDMPIAKRTTFIIGTDGTIQRIFTDVDVHVHGDEVVEALRSGEIR